MKTHLGIGFWSATLLITSSIVVPANAADGGRLNSFTGAALGQLSRDVYVNDPGIAVYSEDLVLSYSFEALSFGLGGTIRLISDISEGDSAIGNMRGHRWELYPAVGYEMSADLAFVVAAIFKLGRYELANQTASKSEIGYGDPLGVRLFATWRPFANRAIGLTVFGDYTVYGIQSEMENNGQELPDLELSDKLRFWTLGLALNIEFVL